MSAELRRRFFEDWFGYVAALFAVATVTTIIGAISAFDSVSNLPMLYLLAVLVAAIRFGRGPAIAASFAAFLTYDWFFIPPYHTLTIDDPSEWVALGLFLIVAVITAQMAARERARAEEAKRREREATLLRRIGQGLGEANLDLDAGLRAAESRLTEDLALAGARITLVDPPSADEPTPPGAETLPLRTPAGERVGTLTAWRAPGMPALDPSEGQLLVAVARQLGAAIERIRLRIEANEAETLRSADELKSALLNAVSHDLRTPLASILASAGSLRQRDIDWTPEEQDEFAGAIVSEAQRLNGIVGNLLDLSRIEGGSLRPDKDWHDLPSLIADTVRRVRTRYPDHFFAVDIPDELPPLLIDWTEIDQVLSNLIENAAKYSPVGTKVWISARRDGPCVRVQVADRGPGIPANALAHLFTPFYRVGGTGVQGRTPGIGLGLAVARGLIEAHGGAIAVRNRDDGGAIFSFTLPIGDRPACPPDNLVAEAPPLVGRA